MSFILQLADADPGRFRDALADGVPLAGRGFARPILDPLLEAFGFSGADRGTIVREALDVARLDLAWLWRFH